MPVNYQFYFELIIMNKALQLSDTRIFNYRFLIICIIIGYPLNISAHDFIQVIKGRIIDQQTQSPIPGASVIVEGSIPQTGALVDADGYFKIEGIRTGRVSLRISFMGYHPVYMNNLGLTTGKELVLSIEMEELVIKIDEIVIKGKKEKNQVNNDMATLSSRNFTIEESQRFAGARNEVSRMASNYAGVSTANDAVNDIVIRRNSPNGLLRRLEGKKTTQEWAFDIQNLSNTKNPLNNEFDSDKNQVRTIYQLGLFPMMQYRITF